MDKRSIGIRVAKIKGETTIKLVHELKLADSKLQIRTSQSQICIPLIRKPSKKELNALERQGINGKVSTYAFKEKLEHNATLRELLRGELPSYILPALPHSADIIGNIAIIEIPTELDQYSETIGQALLKTNNNVKTVLAKASAIGGTYRLRGFKTVAGEPQTLTLHKEYGCTYRVDVAKAYFSPRLSCEHNRVASLSQDGEVVVDLFAGVGPFAILIAKRHPKAEVYAVDVNPDAIELLKENVRINRVENRVHPILGDAQQVVSERLLGIADRVIMNLPEKAMAFVGAACRALKSKGGIVHFYSFVNAINSLEDVQRQFSESTEEYGRKVREFVSSRSVRTTAPHEWQVVLDARIV